MGLISMCLSRRDASTDMQHDLSRSRRNLDLRSNVDLDLSMHMHMHMFRRVLTRGTRWRSKYSASFLSSKLIREKPFYQKRLF